jgi:dephospho-CoA kinase
MQETGDEIVHHRRRPVVVLEATVLLDARWDDLLDGLWVVTAPRNVALHRLIEKRGLTLLEEKKRLNAQESRRGIGNL